MFVRSEGLRLQQYLAPNIVERRNLRLDGKTLDTPGGQP